MSSNLDLIKHFTDCKILFPLNASCAKVLNDLFVLGLSINQFEDKYRSSTKSNIILNTPDYQSSLQYNIATDIWGPKEFIIVNKGNSDYEVGLVYGIRESSEFWTVDSYLSKLPDCDLMLDKPGNKMYRIWPPYTTWERTREIIIAPQRHTEKATMVTVLLNF
jgi:hypothetical protein